MVHFLTLLLVHLAVAKRGPRGSLWSSPGSEAAMQVFWHYFWSVKFVKPNTSANLIKGASDMCTTKFSLSVSGLDCGDSGQACVWPRERCRRVIMKQIRNVINYHSQKYFKIHSLTHRRAVPWSHPSCCWQKTTTTKQQLSLVLLFAWFCSCLNVDGNYMSKGRIY